jgi:hypothetical protein
MTHDEMRISTHLLTVANARGTKDKITAHSDGPLTLFKETELFASGTV